MSKKLEVPQEGASRMNQGKARYSIMPLQAMREVLESGMDDTDLRGTVPELLSQVLGYLTSYLLEKPGPSTSNRNNRDLLVKAAAAAASAIMVEQGLALPKGDVGYSIFPAAATAKVVEVLEAGARKYEVGNYHKGFETAALVDSAVRHIYRRLEGHLVDNTSNPLNPLDKPTYALHVASVLTNVLLLLEQTITGDGKDTRAYEAGRFVGHPDTAYYARSTDIKDKK